MIFILIGILFAFFLCLKLSVVVQYENKELKLTVRVLWFCLGGKGKKTEKQEKKETSREKPQIWDRVRFFGQFYHDNKKYITRALKRLKNGLVVEKLRFYYRCGFDDAAQTALVYGAVSGAFYNFYAILKHHVKVKKTEAQILPEFQQEMIDISFEGIVCLRVANIMSAIIALIPLVFRSFVQTRKRKKPVTV